MPIYEFAMFPVIASFLLIAILGRYNRAIKYIALLGSLTPLLFIPSMAQNLGSITSINWLQIGTTQIPITISLLPINILLFSIVSIVGFLVILYSWGYMEKTSEDRMFYIEMLSFETAMLAFSISGNFILLFVAWEFLSLTSYLLIGFYGKLASIRAARKAVTIILIGDIAMLAGMILLWNNFSTFQFSQLIGSIQGVSAGLEVKIAMLLILVAIMTKSAQFPFSNWLADAMEGPTPVSAYLHSSTMVKAGVFLAFILFGMFAATAMLPVILVIGSISALLAISNALYETHIKRILAYSTVEELSVMLVALGLGAYVVALYLFIVQTFYKALLFFYSGILLKANPTTEDIYQMRNAGQNKALLISAAIGVLSLIGFIPFSGFFGSVFLDGSALSTSLPTYAILLLIDLGTALAMTRWFIIPQRRDIGKKLQNRAIEYSLVKKPMYVAFYIMTALTIISALTILYIPQISSSMANYGYNFGTSVNFSISDAIIFTIICAIGIYLAYMLFYKKNWHNNPKAKILFNNGFLDKIYLYVTYFVYDLSVLLGNFDILVSDLFDTLGQATSQSSMSVRRIQSGKINFYAIVFIVGLLALFAYLIFG